MAYTFTELLDSIKVRGMIPTSQSTFTSARFLVMVNDEIRTGILPMILKCRENYYSYDDDVSVNATGIYNISSRAVGGKVQNLALISGTERLDLPWLSEEELTATDVSPVSRPGAFIKRNQVHLVPPSGHGYTTMRMSIFLRPSEVVAQSSAAQITGISSNTLTFTSGTIPSTFTTSQTYDFVQQNPHFDTLAIDQGISSVTATEMVFTSTPPTRLAVGDWVGLAGQSPVIQLPLELHPLLAQRVANQCLKNSAHTKAYEMGLEEATRLEKMVIALISPRIEKEGKKLANRTGILRRGL